MDLRPDPLQLQLRRALRAGLGAVPVRPGVSGPPVEEGRENPAREVLAQLGSALWELPADVGGLDLGLVAGVTANLELGIAACGNPYRATALVADAALAAKRTDLLEQLDAGAVAAVAGLAGLPAGCDVLARPVTGGWELTGTVAVDGTPTGAGLLAAVCRADGAPALALLRADQPGLEPAPGIGWPAVIRLTGVRVEDVDLLPGLDGPAGGIARARVRQAAYLLGLATGILQAAIEYTGGRRQFGTKLRDLQAVGFPLAAAVVQLRASRVLVDRAAWLVDSADPGIGEAPAEALALAIEALAGGARVAMQTCGVRAMTGELTLQRYHRLAGVEGARFGRAGRLWQLAGAARLAEHEANPLH